MRTDAIKGLAVGCAMAACALHPMATPDRTTVRQCAEEFVKQNGLADSMANPASPLFLPYPVSATTPDDLDPRSETVLKARLHIMKGRACGMYKERDAPPEWWVGFLADKIEVPPGWPPEEFKKLGFFVVVRPGDNSCGDMYIAHQGWHIGNGTLDLCFDNCKCNGDAK